MMRRLKRSRSDRKIAGVCRGLADYFDIDPVIVRLLAVLGIFWHGASLVGYIVAWIVIPEEPFAPPEPSNPEKPAENDQVSKDQNS